MKFTYNWVKDFLDIKISARDLADRLTMTGLEVKSLEKIDNDWIFEAEVTSNRPDLLSVLGIAREVAAITNSKLKIPKPKSSRMQSLRAVTPRDPEVTQKQLLHSGQIPKKSKERSSFAIKIENKKDCPLYTAKIIKDVKVGPSPDWLKERLELIGCRSINNIVDITNYILFTYGQPLHAFDLDRLEGDTIFIRRAKGAEKLMTIDGQERSLSEEILVIADSKRPAAIAGVMGGRDTEVNVTTKNVLLESAKFNPLIIRRVRQGLGISTESSYRFERDVDINTVEPAALYAAGLIAQVAQGKYCYQEATPYIKKKSKSISLNVSNVERILGAAVTQKNTKRILEGLGFKIKKASLKDLTAEIPSFRKDISQEIDLIEEIARLWGYERIPLSIPSIKPSIPGSPYADLLRLVRCVLISQGLNEVITYGLISREILDKAGLDPKEAIEIVNPLSKQQEILRPKLFPGLLVCVGNNINQEEAVSIFQIANVFKDGGEQLILGIALCGEKWFYLGRGRQKDDLGIFHLKGVMELVLNKLGIRGYHFILEDKPYFQKGQSVTLKVNTKDMGCFGQINRQASENFDIKDKPVFVAELYLNEILILADLHKIFKPLPLYPSVQRDISLFVKEDIPVSDILDSIKEAAPPLLKEAKVIDYYKGEQVPSGFKGITVSCLYLSDERTLTDEEVNTVHLTIRDLLKQRFSAQTR